MFLDGWSVALSSAGSGTKGQLSFQDGYFPKVRLQLTSLADALLAPLVGKERLRDGSKGRLSAREATLR